MCKGGSPLDLRETYEGCYPPSDRVFRPQSDNPSRIILGLDDGTSGVGDRDGDLEFLIQYFSTLNMIFLTSSGVRSEEERTR